MLHVVNVTMFGANHPHLSHLVGAGATKGFCSRLGLSLGLEHGLLRRAVVILCSNGDGRKEQSSCGHNVENESHQPFVEHLTMPQAKD